MFVIRERLYAHPVYYGSDTCTEDGRYWKKFITVFTTALHLQS